MFIQLRDASAAYNGVEVLRGINLTIAEGERVAIVGKSGAGKSTLLRLLHSHAPAGVSLVPQELGLVTSLSVFHNIYMGRLSANNLAYNLLTLIRPTRAELARVRDITDALDLSDKLRLPVGGLSGGQQQRTAIGRALFAGGSALIADEPFSALDRNRTNTVLRLILDRHRTVMMALHDLNLALAAADRIVGLADGRIALDRPVERIGPRDFDALGLADD